MQFVLAVIFIIIFIANQAEKNKKNNMGKISPKNIAAQASNDYQANNAGYKRNLEKAFKESSTYQTSQMVNERVADREAMRDVLEGFNEASDKKKPKKAAKASKKPRKTKKEATAEYIDLVKEDNKKAAEEISYGWSIFDDFVASDALYLARKDVEKRRLQEMSYI